jgi:serine/threonine protein phosphatase PrpC
VDVGLDVNALMARRRELQYALLASAVSARRVLPELEQPVREIGQALFAALLGAGEVAGRYRASAAIAAERGHGLRVVLRIDTPELAGLPWEAMYDEGAAGYVCRHEQLVRRVPVASVPLSLTVRPPMRILGVISSPLGLPALDVEKERTLLTKALTRPVSAGWVELHWAASATWADLQDALLEQEWHVVHFIGHGGFDVAEDQGVLALSSEDGRAELVQAHRFADLLRQARPMPRLVVLNSCSGAATGGNDLFAGTAAALVRGGVSAVVAMQYEISDNAATAFARGLYSAIARGRGVDDAVSSGRIAILGTSGRTLEWITPVLYLRGPHAQLFTRPPGTALPIPGAQTSDPDASAAADAHAGSDLNQEGGLASTGMSPGHLPGGSSSPAPRQMSATPPPPRIYEGSEAIRNRLALRYTARSDPGLIREHNQDAAYAGAHLLAIADGMGDDTAGQVASAIAISTLARLDVSPSGPDMLRALASAITDANAALRQITQAHAAIERPSTTLTALLWSGDQVAICHLGNSRAYLLREGMFQQITHDHTLVQLLVDEGKITPGAAAKHPHRATLTRTLDSTSPAEPDLMMLQAKTGDRYLLCTDGLTDVVSDQTLMSIVQLRTDLDEAIDELIDLAIRSGGPDNITCVLADVVDTGLGAEPSEQVLTIGAGIKADEGVEIEPGLLLRSHTIAFQYEQQIVSAFLRLFYIVQERPDPIHHFVVLKDPRRFPDDEILIAKDAMQVAAVVKYSSQPVSSATIAAERQVVLDLEIPSLFVTNQPMTSSAEAALLVNQRFGFVLWRDERDDVLLKQALIRLGIENP